jgi:hypothetical protein
VDCVKEKERIVVDHARDSPVDWAATEARTKRTEASEIETIPCCIPWF